MLYDFIHVYIKKPTNGVNEIKQPSPENFLTMKINLWLSDMKVKTMSWDGGGKKRKQ